MTYAERCQVFKRKHGIGRAFKKFRGEHVPSARSYGGGAFNRLTSDWSATHGTGDAEIRFDIQSLRDRTRDLEREGDIVPRALNEFEKNVLQSGVGYVFQNLAVLPNGKPDAATNQIIESGFTEWSRPKNCTENGEDSLYEVARLSLRSLKRDGGILVRKIINPNVNAFGFALRMIEIDHLDLNYNMLLGNGNRITMGVERNSINKVVAYHLLANHPGDLIFGSSPYNRFRIDASEIIHYFVKDRVTQSVGVPFASPVLRRIRHLEEYEKAELVASREAANKGGYFTSDRGEAYTGEKEETTNAQGEVIQTGATLSDSEPGQHDELPPGMTFVPYDPTHPTSQYGQFTRDAKLGISMGLNMSYATITGDLTKTSFSSMRTGWLGERETYKQVQMHQIEHLMMPIFEAWLPQAITVGKVKLLMSRLEMVSKPMFRGCRWPWIDPVKDVEAKILEVGAGFTTRDAVIDESDSQLDYEGTIRQLAYEEKLAKDEGATLSDGKPQTQQSNSQDDNPPPDEGQPNADSGQPKSKK